MRWSMASFGTRSERDGAGGGGRRGEGGEMKKTSYSELEQELTHVHEAKEPSL